MYETIKRIIKGTFCTSPWLEERNEVWNFAYGIKFQITQRRGKF